MFHKIKYKLFLYFLLFSSISILAVVVSVWFYKKKEMVSSQIEKLDECYILCLEDFKLQHDFLNHEIINPEFHETGKSAILEKQQKLSFKIYRKLLDIEATKNRYADLKESVLDSIYDQLEQNRELFDEVVDLLKRRGFEDYGLEGEMRNHAHALMEVTSIRPEKILMLRRHEKDFIIRKKDRYVQQFNKLVVKIENEIVKSKGLSSKRKEGILQTVDNYFLSFRKLVTVENKLGIKGQTGLLRKLSDNNSHIQHLFVEQKEKMLVAQNGIFSKLNTFAIIIVVVLSVLTIVLSYLIAGILTNPLISLTNSIKQYVRNDFADFPLDEKKTSNYEIETLKLNFALMSKEITTHINSFKEKVEIRTQEIMIQKDEIVYQQEKILVQHDLLKNQKEVLEVQQLEMVEKNKSIMDSIRYAKRIQNAILPPREAVQRILPDSFVFYKPKDIVSGDFYWIDEVKNTPASNFVGEFEMHNNGFVFSEFEKGLNAYNFDMQEEESEVAAKVLIAAVDCTGHGVPGALMSVIGYNSLNKIIHEYKLSEPASILNHLNHEVRQTLRQESNRSEVKDGMDISLCLLDRERLILQFAGANNPMYLVRQQALLEIKGDKFPIGIYKEGSNPVFKNHQLKLEKGDAIYLFSDGYVDQFGGPKGKKFKHKQFRETLLAIQELEMSKQKTRLKQILQDWKGKAYQVDDILVIGVKV